MWHQNEGKCSHVASQVPLKSSQETTSVLYRASSGNHPTAVAGGQLTDVRFKRPPHPTRLSGGVPDARSVFHSSCLPLFFLPLHQPSLLPPPLALSLPLQTKFDALGSGPSREFSVRVTALLNMASDGMILTNHDHQIRVGVLTGKNTKNKQTKNILLTFWRIAFRRLPSRILIHVGWLFFFAWWHVSDSVRFAAF